MKYGFMIEKLTELRQFYRIILDLKILGAIKAGVKEILFPTENTKDYNTFIEKYKNTSLLEGIKFHPVSRIQEVFELVFE